MIAEAIITSFVIIISLFIVLVIGSILFFICNEIHGIYINPIIERIKAKFKCKRPH